MLKLYYHEPFCNIEDEVDFSDRLYMKLCGKYYDFNNIILKELTTGIRLPKRAKTVMIKK